MNLNLPNKLTLLRIILVPVYLLCLWFLRDGLQPLLALTVFAVASLTDMLDGKIARKYNLITNFGKFMDPIADKLLTHTAFIMLLAMGRLNVVSCMIMVAREFMVSGLRLVAVEQGRVIAAGMTGKVKTVLQMLLVCLMTLWLDAPAFRMLTAVLEVAAVAMTLISMIEYVYQNRSVLDGAR